MQIGTFKSSGLGYNGKIETLTLKACAHAGAKPLR